MSKKQKRCIFCNNIIKNSPKRIMYHKMCIIDSIYDTIYDNKPLSKIHYKGSYAYNINISEIRKCVEEDKNGYVTYIDSNSGDGTRVAIHTMPISALKFSGLYQDYYKKDVSSLLKCIEKINAETETMKKILQNWSD